MIQVLCNQMNKGDRLLRNGSSNLAASTYLTALSKLKSLNQDNDLYFTLRSTKFEGYYAVNAFKALRFKLQAGTAAAYLMSRNYKEVCQMTDAALTCNNAHRGCTHKPISICCSHMYYSAKQDWVEDQKLDYVKIHYCKALALKHMGDTVLAIEHMEKALAFDPGDGTVYAQLMLLKGKLEEDAARKARLEKLNARQNQLRRKQKDRREKGSSPRT